LVNLGRVDCHRRDFSNCRTSVVRTSTAGADGQSNSLIARTDVCDGEIVYCAWLSARSCHCYRASSATSASQRFTPPRGTSGRAAPTFMTRVLVTGGSRFIGQHLVSALVTRGRQVRVLDLRPPSCALPEVRYVEGSVLDPDLVNEALRGVDEVYHLAGLPGMWQPQKRFSHRQLPRHGSRHYGSAQALHVSCTARPNPFFSARCHQRMPISNIPCCRPTTCRVYILARKCSWNSSQCKLRHLAFRQ
jgi:NAD dependent epimerase/dehydratase family